MTKVLFIHVFFPFSRGNFAGGQNVHSVHGQRYSHGVHHQWRVRLFHRWPSPNKCNLRRRRAHQKRYDRQTDMPRKWNNHFVLLICWISKMCMSVWGPIKRSNALYWRYYSSCWTRGYNLAFYRGHIAPNARIAWMESFCQSDGPQVPLRSPQWSQKIWGDLFCGLLLRWRIDVFERFAPVYR